MHDLKRFFERGDVYRICLFIAVITKIALYLHFFQFEGDKLFQSLGAKNLVEGNGLTFQHVLPQDISTIVYEPINRWPPGYSLLITPFYLITHHLETSSLIVDIVSIILFFGVLHVLLRSFRFPQYLITLLILFNGATFAPYISKPTDLLANVGILYSCYLSLVFLSNPLRSARFGYVIGAVNVIPVLFRFMYLPGMLVLPVLLITAGYLKKDARIKRGGVNCLILSIALTGCILLFQMIYTGSTSYLFLSGKGFYPKNLLMLYPFVLSAFIDTNFVQQQISLISGVPYRVLFEYVRMLNAIIFVALVIGLIRFIIQKSRNSFTKWDFFVISAGVINLAILFVLFYLSVINSPGSRLFTSRFRWTFVEEGRFFTFAMTVLPIIAGYYLFVVHSSKFPGYQKLFRYLFAGLIFFQVVHTFYFLAQRFKPLGLEGGNVLLTTPAKVFLKDLIQDSKQKDWNVVLTGNDETVSNWAALNNEKGLLDLNDLNTHKIVTSKPTVVLIVLEARMLPVFKNILSRKNVRLEKQVGHLYIYSMRVEMVSNRS